jgi:DNA-binding GntR family transcriptional regulator
MLGANRAEKKFRASVEDAAGEIRKAILQGKILPGEQLSEEKLAASLRASRVVLREALRALEAQGYVTFLPNKHVIASNPSRDDMHDYYTIAGVLEGLAARLAVERAQPDEIARLRELHQVLREACHKGDVLQYFDANSNFHRFIAELSHNERLYQLIEELRREIQKTRLLSLHMPQRLDYSMREHDQIMDAFLKKNPQLAESMMVQHLSNHLKALGKALDSGSEPR